jgi:septal ring-binding cell division protein DamX
MHNKFRIDNMVVLRSLSPSFATASSRFRPTGFDSASEKRASERGNLRSVAVPPQVSSRPRPMITRIVANSDLPADSATMERTRTKIAPTPPDEISPPLGFMLEQPWW